MIEENAKVGLHDCRTNHIQYQNGMLIFSFPNGYYLLNETEPVQTGRAYMECQILDEFKDSVSMFIYRKTLFGKVIREDYSDKFLSAINAGKFEFEFVSTYRSYQHILFKGYIWFKQKPYYRECEIEVYTDKINYHWMENDNL